jgi:ketosteroid isomerase-like protein
MADPITDADIERARVGYRKFREGDPSTFDDWDPDVEIHLPTGLPGGGALRGVLEFLEFQEGMREHWEEAYPEPEEFLSAGDKLIVLGTWHARARKTGRTAAVPFAHVYEVRDGKTVYFRNYTDSSETLESLEEPRE